MGQWQGSLLQRFSGEDGTLVAFGKLMELERQSERRMLSAREVILLREKEAIAQRVRGVCQWMTDAEFDVLVTRMAEISIRFRARRDEGY